MGNLRKRAPKALAAVTGGVALLAAVVCIAGCGTRDTAPNVSSVSRLEADLRTWWDIFQAYAAATRGERFPPPSRWPGAVFPDVATLYPAHLETVGLLVSPARPNALRRRAEAEAMAKAGLESAMGALDHLGAESYFYFPHLVFDEEMGMAMLAVWRTRLREPAADGQLSPMEPDLNWDSPKRTAHGPAGAWRLRIGIERFLLTDRVGEARGAHRVVNEYMSRAPVLLERPGAMGGPLRMLGADGVVRTVPYGEFPNTPAILGGLESLRDASRPARDRLERLFRALHGHAATRPPPAHYPTISRTAGRIFFDSASVYPERLEHLSDVVAPLRPHTYAHQGHLAHASDKHEAIESYGARSYFYTGFAVEDARVGQAYVEAYRAVRGDGASLPQRAMLEDLIVDAGSGNAGSDRIIRLRADFDHYAAAMLGAAAPPRAVIPVLIERPVADREALHVLYADGRVRLVPHGIFPNNPAYLQGLASLSDRGPRP